MKKLLALLIIGGLISLTGCPGPTTGTTKKPADSGKPGQTKPPSMPGKTPPGDKDKMPPGADKDRDKTPPPADKTPPPADKDKKDDKKDDKKGGK